MYLRVVFEEDMVPPGRRRVSSRGGLADRARSPPFTVRCTARPRLRARRRLQPPPCRGRPRAHAPNTLRLLPLGPRRRPFLDKLAAPPPGNRPSSPGAAAATDSWTPCRLSVAAGRRSGQVRSADRDLTSSRRRSGGPRP